MWAPNICPFATPKLTMLVKWGLLSQQGDPCTLLGSMGLGGEEDKVGETQLYGSPPPHGSFPTNEGLQEEDHFPPGVFLFSLPNRKLA